MARWLWIFWIYSFLGYGLEKLFAAVTHAPNQGRKCFLLLPLCPVYGLGMLAVLALPARGWWLVLWGGLAATAVEYAYHWACETFLGVRFWDYSWVKAIAAAIPWQVTYACLLVFTADAVCSARFLRQTHDIEALRWAVHTTWNR